jgi:hypothetical protein
LLARAERVFFGALTRKPEMRGEALRVLAEAVRRVPNDGATNLWLGMAHLWAAAEAQGEPGAGGDAGAMGHAIIAEHYLARAQRLRPADGRIAGWLGAVRLGIAEGEGDAAAVKAAMDGLRTAFKADPCFQSVALGTVLFEHPRGSAEFKEGLGAMRAALACAAEDPSAQNAERWPHNVEGFCLAMAQYELKAGNRQRAETMLMVAQGKESYARWPRRGLVEDQFERVKEAIAAYADGEPGNDPVMVLSTGSGVSCLVCHQGE